MPLPTGEIVALEDRYWRTVAALDVDAYLALHTEDYLGWPSFADRPSSAAGLEPGLRAFVRTVVQGTLDFQVEVLGATTGHDSLIVYSQVAWGYEAVQAARADFTERFTHIWRRTAEQWKLAGAMSYQLKPASDARQSIP